MSFSEGSGQLQLFESLIISFLAHLKLVMTITIVIIFII